MVANQTLILRAGQNLTHLEACRLSRRAISGADPVVVIDLSQVGDATTAAFAQLVLLRRQLLARGRDLRLAGLTGVAAGLFEVHRLDGVLPIISRVPAKSAAAPGAHPGAFSASKSDGRSRRIRHCAAH